LTGDVVVKADDATGIVTVGNLTGANVTLDVSSSIAGATIGAITAKTSATVALSDLQANNTDTKDLVITAGTGSTALAVAVTGGALADTVVINGISTNTSITVTGDLGAGTDTLTVASGSASAAQTISISGVTNYDSSTITGGNAGDTITGGAGVDRIIGGRGADSLSGNGGNDTFVFAAGESKHGSFDTITDLNSGDKIEYGNSDISLQTTEITGDTDTAAVSTKGVATFTAATTSSTLANKATLIADALSTNAGKAVLFQHGSDTYMFINDGVAGIDNDVVVKLTGVALPTTDLTAPATGLSGFGA
jgi:Ca2+-binding RTX toxin-like protein